jgi:signal transduction histidine kinase
LLESSGARRVEVQLEGRWHASPSIILQRSGAGQPTVSPADATGRDRIVLPIRRQGRRVGVVRLVGPQWRRWENLQAALDRAGMALSHADEWQRARTQARRFTALLENLEDWNILVLSRDGVVREIDGGPLLQAIREHWIDQPLMGPPHGEGLLDLPRSRVRHILASTLRSGHAELETRLRLPGGPREVHLTLIALPEAEELLGVVRDLSTVRAMETALLRRNQELSEAAERLKEIDMLKNEFLSNVSHELRTPLTAIIAYTETLLLTRPKAKTREQFLHVIAEQGDKLQKLIAGLLDIAKLDSLATELKLHQGSLNRVIEAAIVTVQPTADKNQILLRKELDPDLPLVYLDELRSQQIVWNLLANAIKFSPPDSTVRVRSWAESGHAWVSVRDEGVGIAPEHQELIFQKFVQVDGSSTRKHGGVGLGLDLVKHLVELHGGQVRVESAPGQGSTFAFSIPIEKRRRPRKASEDRRAHADRRS